MVLIGIQEVLEVVHTSLSVCWGCMVLVEVVGRDVVGRLQGC